MANQLRARHDRALVVIFKKALGDQLIKVSEPRLIFHQNDEMIPRQVFQLVLAIGRRGENRVDICRRYRVQLVLEPCKELDKNAPQHGRILACAVVLKRADRQFFRQYVELELMQMRQHQTAHFQRVDRGKVPLDLQPLACRAQKPHIKARIVRDERIFALARPRKEFRHRFGKLGRVRDRLVRNAG